MSSISRRDILKGSATLLGLAAIEKEMNLLAEAASSNAAGTGRAPVIEAGKVDTLAPDVYFQEGKLVNGICNAGWVVFEDYVLVIDASYPDGARDVISKVRAITEKPIRFAFDTHHHGDHAYGNKVMLDDGATPVAHTGVIEEMKRYETGYYGGKPGRWESSTRPDVKASHLKPPSVLFPHELFFDDGKHRVEMLHLGVAHTHGDAVAWLPKERILFSGDICVNGPYNFVGDGNVEQWVGTLAGARRLGATIVCPGHGSRGTADLLAEQQEFFKQLRERVGTLVKSRKSPAEIHDSLSAIQADLAANTAIARYVSKGALPSQVEKVLNEMTGQSFPDEHKTSGAARDWHADQHGLYRRA